jgi:hypothetical protein
VNREIRLAAPRRISDPDHGFIGTLTKDSISGWNVESAEGGINNHFATKKQAINYLCDVKGIERWFLTS